MSASENTSEVKDKNEIMEDSKDSKSPQVYELGYLLAPSITGEDVPGVFGNLKELISSFGGGLISDEMPKMISLAYTMSKVVSNVRNKWSTAYFGWIKFEMSTAKISDLKKKLDLEPQIIRFLILKTIKENTIAAKRFVYRDMGHKRAPTVKKDGENEAPVEINKEEIDKEIDAMVAI